MKLLLVENIKESTYLFRNILNASNFNQRVSLQDMRKGEEAILFLRNLKNFRFAIPPDVLVVAQEMPGISCHETIAAIRELPGINEIPIVMIGEKEPTHPFGAHPDAYFKRPKTEQELLTLVEEIESMLILD